MSRLIPLWLVAAFAILLSASSSAQQFSALIDTDQNALTGCSLVSPDGSANGIDWRITATVGGDPPQVTAVERSRCESGSFAAPIAMPAGYPVGLNNGVDDADVVEFAASLVDLSGISGNVNIHFLAQSAGGADLLGPLPLNIGGISGGPIVTAPAIIPTMHWLGLTIIFFAVLLLARRHRALRGMAAVLMLVGAGLVWAANFIPDGQVGDWATESPLATSPAPSSTNGASDNDIVAVWAADEGGRLFLRVDVLDLEAAANATPVAQPQSVSTSLDTPATVLLVCTDADGDALSFAIAAGPTNGTLGTLAPLTSSTASVTYTPAAAYSGPDSFQFTCDDGSATSAPASVTITVSAAPNAPPSFTSAPVTGALVDAAYSYDVLVSDDDAGDTLSLTAPLLPAWLSLVDNGNRTGSLSGTPGAADAGVHPVVLQVSDGIASVTQEFSITVSDGPVITSASATSFLVGNAGAFTFTTAGNPTVTSISLTGALPDGVSFADQGNGTATLTGVPAPGSAADYPVQITAVNGVGPDAVQNFTLVVNQAPSFDSAGSISFLAGSFGSFTVLASGRPAPALANSGALPAGIGFVDNGDGTATLSGTPATGTGGSYPLTFTASNSAGSVDQGFTLTVNEAPSFTSASGIAFTVGDAGNFAVTTSANPTVTSITRVGDPLPTGLNFTDNADGTATLAGTPDALSGGTYAFAFTASNGIAPDGVQNFNLTVNEAPVITSANSAAFAIGSPQSFTFAATGFPAATFALGGCAPTLPASLGLNASSGELSGTPQVGEGGIYVCTLTASNGIGSDATQPFTLDIEEAPRFTSTAATTFTVGDAGSFDVTTAANPAVASIIRTGAALPAGMTFTDNTDGTGVLAGTPAALTGGVYAFSFAASNGVPPDGTQNFTLTVNEAPAITSANSATFTVGAAQSFTLVATGFPSPTFALSSCAPTLPASLNLDSVSGVLSGTPQPGEGGSYSCTATASNGVGSDATQVFTLDIEEAPSITSGNTAGFTVGNAGSFTATASGFPAPSFTLDACMPALPASLSFDGGSGLLTGTPLDGEGGSHACTLTATNGVTPDAVQGLTVEIDQPPLFTSADNTTFTVGQASSFPITTSGFPPAAITQTGTLPGGVGFTDNGDGTATLSGTPAAGSQNGSPYALTLGASNGAMPDATQSFTLNVECPTIALDPATGAFAVNFGSAFNQAFTPSGGTGPYTVDLTGTLPPGVGLDGSSGVVSGTATDAGVYSFSLQATDAFDCTSPSQSYTLTVSPVATADTYNALGNVLVDSSIVPFSVVGNDSFPAGTTISAFDASSSPGNGAVTMIATGAGMGQFTYNPPRGRASGNETIGYTLSRQGVGATAAATASATITFTHSGRVWFVDAGSSCAASCDGRLSNPYTSLAAFQADNNGTGSNPADNDSVFVYSGSYTGPVILRAGQRLIGQGAVSTLATLAGVSGQPGQTLPATGGSAPSLSVAAGGTIVTLGNGNRLHGVHFGNAGAAGTAILGNGFGTLTISENVLINSNGRALSLENGAVAGAGFSSVSSNGSGSEGIRLVALGAGSSLELGNGAIAGSTGAAFLAQGALGTVNYAGTLSKTSAGRLVDISGAGAGNLTLSGNLSCTGSCGTGIGNHGLRVTGRTGGTLTFSGASKAFNSSATNPGLSLTGNSGATLSFSNGGLAIATTSGNGLEATGGGVVNVTGTGNAIGNATGIALLVDHPASQATNLNFATVSSSGAGSTHGIRLNNISGSVSVSGAISIGGKTTAGIEITNSSATIALSNASTVTIANRPSTGIRIANSSGLMGFGSTTINSTGVGTPAIRIDASSSAVTFAQTNINMNGAGGNENFEMVGSPGNHDAYTPRDNSGDGDAIYVTGLSGSLSINGGTITQPGDDGIDIRSSSNLTIANMTFVEPGRSAGAACVDCNSSGIQAFGLTGVNTVSNSTFQRGRLRNFYISNPAGSTTLNISGSTFDDTRSQGSPATDNLQIYASGTATAAFNISNSTFTRAATNQINAVTKGNAVITELDITGNTLNNSGGPSAGLRIDAEEASQISLNVINNPVIYTQDENVITVSSTGTAHLQGRIANNPDMRFTTASPGGSVFGGIRAVTDGSSSRVTLAITNNTLSVNNGQDGMNLSVQGTGSARIDVTATGNAVTAVAGLGNELDGINGFVNPQVGVAKVLCMTVANNTVSGPWARAARARAFSPTGTYVTGYSGSFAATWAAQGNTSGALLVSEFANGGGVVAAPPVACSTPSHPMP